MALPEPIKWRSKIILAKIEAAYGSDAAPAAANAMLMTNVSLSPMEGEDASRDLELAWLGGQEAIPVAQRVRLEGEVELVPSGAAGTPPAWGPLLRACGVAETITPGASVIYNPVSENHESASIYFWIGPTQHILLGVRGTVEMTVEAQTIPKLKFTLTGLFTTPADVARVAPDVSAFQAPQAASTANTPAFTIGGVDFALRAFSFDLGNDVQHRLLVKREQIIIVDRAEAIRADVEAQPLASFNPFAFAVSRQKLAVNLQHGAAAGKIATFNAPAATMGRLSGYQENQKLLEWPLALSPLPVNGDDQWTLSLT